MVTKDKVSAIKKKKTGKIENSFLVFFSLFSDPMLVIRSV